MRRVVVTGLGAISPLGLSVSEHCGRLVAGESNLEPMDPARFGNYPPILQSRVRKFDARRFVPDRMLRKLLSPSPAMAVASAAEALADAAVGSEDCTDCGLFVGSVCLDVNPEALIPALRESISEDNVVDLERFATRGIKLVDPLFLVKSLPNAGLCAIAIQHQILGPNANLTNGTVSGMQAVIAAFGAIQEEEADIALAGGYDSLLQMDCVVEHLVAGRLASTAGDPARSCRPFRPASGGYALGEGAAFLVLESWGHARTRGAHVYGEVLACGEASAPSGLLEQTAAGPEALVAAASQALQAAALGDDCPDAVFGDAVGLPFDDNREIAAFGSATPGARAFTAATPALGFVGAASGPFSLIHALMAFRTGIVPAVLNCEDLAHCPMPIVRERRADTLRTALIWNSDRGIKNAAMLIAAPAR